MTTITITPELNTRKIVEGRVTIVRELALIEKKANELRTTLATVGDGLGKGLSLGQPKPRSLAARPPADGGCLMITGAMSKAAVAFENFYLRSINGHH